MPRSLSRLPPARIRLPPRREARRHPGDRAHGRQRHCAGLCNIFLPQAFDTLTVTAQAIIIIANGPCRLLLAPQFIRPMSKPLKATLRFPGRQQGWSVTQGSASVTDTGSAFGSQSIVLQPGTPRRRLSGRSQHPRRRCSLCRLLFPWTAMRRHYLLRYWWRALFCHHELVVGGSDRGSPQRRCQGAATR